MGEREEGGVAAGVGDGLDERDTSNDAEIYTVREVMGESVGGAFD